MMARYPAPMAGWSHILPMVVDTIIRALAPAMKDNIPAAHHGLLSGGVVFFGKQPKTGRGFVVQSIEGGGWGGRPTAVARCSCPSTRCARSSRCASSGVAGRSVKRSTSHSRAQSAWCPSSRTTTPRAAPASRRRGRPWLRRADARRRRCPSRWPRSRPTCAGAPADRRGRGLVDRAVGAEGGEPDRFGVWLNQCDGGPSSGWGPFASR